MGEVERHEMGGRGRAKLELLAVTQGECRTQEPPGGVEGAWLEGMRRACTEGLSGASSANCTRT